MKTCPQCRASLPDEAMFCMKCGARFAPASPAPSVAVPTPSTPNRSKWIALGILGAIVAAIGIYLGASGLLKARALDSSDRLLKAQGAQATPGLLETQAKPDSGLAQARGPEPREHVEMPADVRAWLEHLERCERRRVDLVTDQITGLTMKIPALQLGMSIESLLGSLDDPEAEMKAPPDDLQKEIETVRQDCRAFLDYFRSMPPPAECAPIAASYETAAGETSGMIFDLLDVFAGWKDDMKATLVKLQKMKGKSDPIDRAGRETDRLVQQICNKYETRKWFDINGDIGGGGMLQKLGGL